MEVHYDMAGKWIPCLYKKNLYAELHVV